MHRPPKSIPKAPLYPYPHNRKANTPDHFPHASHLTSSQPHNKSTTMFPSQPYSYPNPYQSQQQQQQQHVKSMRDTVAPSASITSSPLEVENAEYLEIVRGKAQPAVDFRIGGGDVGIRGGLGAVSGRSFKIRNVGAFKTINYNINRSVKQNSFPFKLSYKPNTISPSPYPYPYAYPNQPTKSSTTLHHPQNKQSIINIKNIEKLDQYQRKLQLQLQQQRQQQLWLQGQQQQQLGQIKQNNYNQHMKQQQSGLQKSRIQARLWPYPQHFCLGDLGCKIYSCKVGAPSTTAQHPQQRPHYRSRQTIRSKPRQQSQSKPKPIHPHTNPCPPASSIPAPTPTPTPTHSNWCIILSQSIFYGSLSQQLNLLKLKGLVDGIRRHHPLITVVVRLNVVHSERDVEGVVGRMRDKAVGVDWVIWGKNKYHENINVFDISSITNANTSTPVPISNDKQNMSIQMKPHKPNTKPLDRFIIIQDNHEVVRNIYYKQNKRRESEARQQGRLQDGKLGVDDTYNQQSQYQYLTIQPTAPHHPHILSFSPSKSKSKSRQAQHMSNKKSRRRYQLQLQLQLQKRQMKRFMHKSVNEQFGCQGSRGKSDFSYTTPVNISNITKPKPNPSPRKTPSPKYLYLKFNGLPHLLKFIHKFRIDEEKQLVYLQAVGNGNDTISGDNHINNSNAHNQSVNSCCSGGKGQYFIDDTLGVFELQALREKIRIYNIRKNISTIASNKAKLQRSSTNPIQKNQNSGKKSDQKYSSKQKQKQKTRNASYSKSKNTHNNSISNTINASSKELNQKKDKNSEIVARNEELKIKMVQFIKILVEENKNKIRDKDRDRDRRKNSSAAYILQPKQIPIQVHQLPSYCHILNPRPQSSHKHKPQSADSTSASSTQNANYSNTKMNDQFCYKTYLQQAQSKSSHQIVSELIKNNLYNQKQISKFYERAVGSGFGGAL